jgi:beta-glucosidase
MDIYRDAAKSVAERVADLLSKMTLDEKIAQIGSIWAMEVLEDRKFSAEKAAKLMKNGLGGISRAGVGTALKPGQIAVFVNGLQRFLVENTRLGIPAIVHEECLTGFIAREATIFPQIIGMAGTWEPGLMQKIMEVTRGQMLSVGVRQGLSPVLDVARDPRWGRMEETFGEDPYLIARMGVAYVRGLQGDDIRNGVIATVKHFAGYGKPEAGLNHAPSDIPPRMLREVYLYPFEKAVREAGVLSVMNAYQEIDGLPCAASRELLTTILRDEWGFDGIVVSDYYAVLMLNTFHRLASGRVEAARLALAAGIDMELPEHGCYTEALSAKVAAGEFPIDIIDRAVARVLKMKFRLGLFEKPYVEDPDVVNIFDTVDNRALALQAARKSIVLLKNEDNLLPLDKGAGTIAVIGPHADSARNQLGDYTYPGHIGITAMTADSLGCRLPAEDILPDTVPVKVVTLLEGITARAAAGAKVLYAAGCGVSDGSEDGIAEAVAIARQADIVILTVGGKSGLMPDCTCGEMRDSASLGLPWAQEQLVRAVYETGKPVVLVIVDGRPLALGWMADKIPAIVMAWKPGEEGGNAVADVLFGDYNPGGKLPVTFPRSAGQVPIYYGIRPSGGKSQFWGDYTDLPVTPQYEFGFGLSYTTFELSNLRVSPARVKADGTVIIKADVKNTGGRQGDEVVQLYINDVVSSLTRPVLQLKGFSRLSLQPGQTATVEFALPVKELAYYDIDMKLAVEPGIFKVMVGTSSKNLTLTGQFEVEG